MLRIRTEQEEAIAETTIRRFAAECVPFLMTEAPEWSAGHSEKELRHFVDTMLEFAHDCNIYKTTNIRALMLLKVEHDYEIPLTGYLHAKTNRNAFDEDYRVEHLTRILKSGNRPVLITLDTNLEALRKRNGR